MTYNEFVGIIAPLPHEYVHLLQLGVKHHNQRNKALKNTIDFIYSEVKSRLRGNTIEQCESYMMKHRDRFMELVYSDWKKWAENGDFVQEYIDNEAELEALIWLNDTDNQLQNYAAVIDGRKVINVLKRELQDD